VLLVTTEVVFLVAAVVWEGTDSEIKSTEEDLIAWASGYPGIDSTGDDEEDFSTGRYAPCHVQ